VPKETHEQASSRHRSATILSANPRSMAFFDARSCSVQFVVFDPSTGRCAPVDPVLDYDEKSVPTAAPSVDALLAFACESETSGLVPRIRRLP
jgi:hypothetical protein